MQPKKSAGPNINYPKYNISLNRVDDFILETNIFQYISGEINLLLKSGYYEYQMPEVNNRTVMQ
jgi:hypothetical protein